MVKKDRDTQRVKVTFQFTIFDKRLVEVREIKIRNTELKCVRKEKILLGHNKNVLARDDIHNKKWD